MATTRKFKRFFVSKTRNWSPGLILGAFCIMFGICPVGVGLGAKFGLKMTEQIKTRYIYRVNKGYVFLKL